MPLLKLIKQTNAIIPAPASAEVMEASPSIVAESHGRDVLVVDGAHKSLTGSNEQAQESVIATSGTAEVFNEQFKNATQFLAGLAEQPSVVELVGSWLWVEFKQFPGGDTVDAMKSAGFWWAPKHRKWYKALTESNQKKKYRKSSGWTYEKIATVYQAEELKIK